MFDCNFSLETYVSNLVSLTHSSLQILDETQPFMEICHYFNFPDLLLRSIAAIPKADSACMVHNALIFINCNFLSKKGEFRMKNL